MFKRNLLIIIVMMLLITISGGQNLLAQDFTLDVDSAILIDAKTGQILFEQNADNKVPPASITKIMTLLVAIEKVENDELSLDDEFTVSNFASSMQGSQLYLPAGAQLTLADLFKAVSISSANDASVALAEAVAGNYSSFIELMNEKAEELGMENTNFLNSSGYPEDRYPTVLPPGEHYSTARDIARMSRELVKYDKILDWTSTWLRYLELPEWNREIMVANTNKLLQKYQGLDGLRTGHTAAAGYCLSATAKRDDVRLISVILGAATDQDRQRLTTHLLDYGFNSFRKREVIKQDEEIENIIIPYGQQESTTVRAAENLEVLVKKGQPRALETEIRIKSGLEAPVEKGEIVGEKVVIYENQEVDSTDLIATEDIKRVNIFVQLWRLFISWLTDLFDLI